VRTGGPCAFRTTISSWPTTLTFNIRHDNNTDSYFRPVRSGDCTYTLLQRLTSTAAHTDEMGDANITTSAWRLVEVGRVVLFNEGQYEGRLATVVEIIDHKRVRRACKLGAEH
jgi:hypothetical protein